MNTNQDQMITDVIPDRKNINRMVNTAWHVVSTGIFAATKHNKAETAMAKTHIRNFITRSGDAYKNYAEFCQRIIMVRRYKAHNPGFHIRFGIVAWLNPEIARGFAGTALWFERLAANRKENPIHLIALKAFPEAILELAEELTADIFNYWNDWFQERRQADICAMTMMVGAKLAFEAGIGKMLV